MNIYTWSSEVKAELLACLDRVSAVVCLKATASGLTGLIVNRKMTNDFNFVPPYN